MNKSTSFQPVRNIIFSGISLRCFPAFLTVWGGQTEREAAFLNIKLHAARFRICVGHSSQVFSLGFVMAGRSFLLVGMEKGQSIFSAALVGGYSILVCCFQIYKIACCSAIAIFSIPFSCYFINISAQFKSEYVSNNSYIFAVCSRLSPMFVTPALHT